ncbi:Bromodomain protein [Dictyocaulus viviparus]|uniref:Bromodomain protein n=1 Tax=Dictyocaulus viviparus TaxID=29172 RepID=A0A0D8XR61_DICVI|nr:Bromodomain protein [Dictyocaulus viviparus]
MASFMKMFKNKKGSNKENLPNVDHSTFGRSSTGTRNFITKRSDAGVYTGDTRTSKDAYIPNPYSVITSTKKSRGPRSCPGFPIGDRRLRNGSYRGEPFSDRYSSINTSMRYENIGKRRKNICHHEAVVEYSSESANSSRESPHDVMNGNEKISCGNQRYYTNTLNDSTDDDDGSNVQILQLEAKLKRARDLIRSTRRNLSERIEELQDEIERKSQDYDTLKWHYKQVRKALEEERKINARQAKKLHQALEELSRLKTMLTDQSNDSSFLIPYCGGMPSMCYNSGAGEALCSLVDNHSENINDRLCSLNEVQEDNASEGLSSQTEHTTTRESTAEPPQNRESQDDVQDEVRVFRTAECDTPPPERPRAIGSPIVGLSSHDPFPDFTVSNELVPQRSFSDTDIRALIHKQVEEFDIMKAKLPIEGDFHSVSKEIRTNHDFHIKGYDDKVDETGSIVSSDDETYRILEKQLKKKGDVVRFQPPRVTIQPKHYKRFGKMERCALAEFDYLQDLSTDRMEVDDTLVNGLAGSKCADDGKMEEDNAHDSDEGRSEFYLNHPCARNESYPSTSQEFVREEDSFNPKEYIEVSTSKSHKTFIPPSKRDDAPLASILNPQLDNIDPRISRRFFTDYELDSVVRFSRIFAANIKSSSKAEIWWPSKTYHKRVSSEKISKAEKKRLALNFAPDPPVEALVPDEEALMMAMKSNSKPHPSMSNSRDGPVDEVVAPWRAGPAKIWFDRAGVPSTASTFDYGLTKRKKEPNTEYEPEKRLLPAELIEWEDEIMIEGDDFREEVLDELKYGAEPACGWVPTQYTRTRIWILEPKVLSLDYLDDPLVYGMPDDRRSDDPTDMTPNKPFDRKEHQFTKKSKMILGQVQQRQKARRRRAGWLFLVCLINKRKMETSVAQLTDKDPFNLSNDDYYLPKTINKSGPAGNSMLIQHSIPAQNIHRTFFPTFLIPSKLRHFHRQPLSKRVIRQFNGRWVEIKKLTKYIKIKEEQREKQRCAEGGGDIFFMRDVGDLSGRDGDLILLEYSEEHPPLLCQPGMASKIKNYYKKKPGKDVDPDFEYGDMAYLHSVPFLGQLQPGQAMQSIENNLFRAPIYRHSSQHTDYLLIRNRNGWYIRPCPPIFLVGQECPLYEVPSPNSKRATIFVRDFLLAFIYRLFWASEHRPRRLKMDDIKAAFPHYAESSVRKRLKQCSDFKRLGTGPDQNYWVLRPEFRLPSKEEVLAMVTPEMCCAQYSMLAAEQRLKDAGYGEKYFFTPENEDDSDDQVTIEDEIKCAPWNTTRAFLSSMRGKCLLDQTGIADPTGCGQGFSYVRVSQKPQKINALSRWEIIDVIRTLSTQAAKAKADSSDGNVSGMARFARGNIRFNFADMQEKTLANPEALSTDEGSSGEDSDNEELATRLETMLQANKGKKHISMSERARMEFENEEKERQDLKRMVHGDTNTKNDKDKKEATAEEKKNVSKIGEDLAASASKISGITANQKLKIYRTMKNPDGTESTRVEVVTRPQLIEAYTRIRMTKDENFIEVYAQMDEQFKEVRMFIYACHGTGHMKTNKNCPLYGKDPLKTAGKDAGSATSEGEEEASSLTGELVAVEGTKVKISRKLINSHEQSGKKKKPKSSQQRHLSDESSKKHEDESLCSSDAGGGVSPPILVKQEREQEFDSDFEQSLTPTTRPRLNAGAGVASAKRRISTLPEEDYLQGPHKSVQRIRADPKVTMGTLLTEIVNELKTIPGSEHLMFAVNAKKVKDYYDIIKNPMDLQKIKSKIADNKYELRQEFLLDVKRMLDNSRLYNGDNHVITDAAKKMFELASKRLVEKEQQLMKLEKAINPLLDDNDRASITHVLHKIPEIMVSKILAEIRKSSSIVTNKFFCNLVGFGFVLEKIVQACKNIPKSVPFHTRVDAKKVQIPFYYQKITRPMDLGTIEANVKAHRYVTVQEFRDDIHQILINSEMYNGPAEKSSYTAKATEIVVLADKMLADHAVQLSELEANINGFDLNIGEVEPEIEDAMANDEEMSDVEDGGVLVDDLALSGNEVEDEEMDESMWSSELLQSRMHSSGQLNNDLALSDSDDEERMEAIKRGDSADNLLDSF